jgi:hypothetical protein
VATTGGGVCSLTELDIDESGAISTPASKAVSGMSGCAETFSWTTAMEAAALVVTEMERAGGSSTGCTRPSRASRDACKNWAEGSTAGECDAGTLERTTGPSD